MIFCSGPNHRRPTDIDVLDTWGSNERIQVRYHKVDRRYLAVNKLLHMVGLTAIRQDPTVNNGMKRLHPAIEHLISAGDVAYGAGVEPGSRQRSVGATAAHELKAKLSQPSGERHEARLVAYGEQCAHRDPWKFVDGVVTTLAPSVGRSRLRRSDCVVQSF